nr:hypothetical protein [Ectobacillus panaciterrae]
MLGKIIFPITLLITILKYTPVLLLFLIRMVAVLLTIIVSIIWRRMDRKDFAYEN